MTNYYPPEYEPPDVQKLQAERDRLREKGRAFLAALEPFAHRFPSSVWNKVYDEFRQALEGTSDE